MAERNVFLRTAELDFAENEVTGMIAPFDQEAVVVDIHPDTKEPSRFREVFRRGSFTKMISGLSARGWTNAISLNFDHKSDVGSTIGFATDIEERVDGVYGKFTLYDDPSIAKVKSMLQTSHRGMSVGFMDMRHRTVGTLVERLAVHIDHVAATATPSYAGAGVTSVRAEDIFAPDTELELDTPNLDALKAELEALRA